MADETKAQADPVTATAKPVDSATQTAAQTAKTAADEGAKTAKAGAKSVARATDRVANATKTTSARKATKARKSSKTNARRAKAPRSTTRTAKAQPAAARKQGNDTVSKTNTNFFGAFEGLPTVAPFQSLFADAGERSQEAARRSQQATEEFADIARGNVEALVEASRVAAEGARSIGQDVIAKSRSSVEQTADAIRSLAEAKSPTEFVQLQGDYARASFDRLVTDSSKLTESLVKLAGEAIQPISNRATASAKRFNSFVA